MELENKNIVFIGGAGGIGQETCKELARKDIKHLVILDKCTDIEALRSFMSKSSRAQLHFWNYDVTMQAERMKEIFHQIVTKIKKIDVLIYGAGVLNDREIAQTVQINLMGCINTIVAAFDYMDRRKSGEGGVIVNIASVAGLNGFPTVPVYSATKAAIINFSTSIAQMEPITAVKVFTVCPGITRTSILHKINTFLDFDDTLSDKIAKLDIQTSAECARNFVKVIEECKNGSVWILDNNERKLVELPVFWQSPKELL